MSPKLTSRFCLSLSAALFLAGLGTGFAQGFQLPEPENLQILPKDISSRELRETMRNFSQSLGVQCEFCHVGRAGDPSSFDYAADKKGHKKKARIMMKMTSAINETYLPELGGEPEERMHVTCMTCHRKLAEPVTLQDALAKKINEEGIDSALSRYERLKKQYYGSFAYDFSPGTLANLAERLGREGKAQEAFQILDLESKEHPDSHLTHMVRATLLMQAGNREAAGDSLQKALELAPRQFKGRIERQLQRLQP